MKIYPWLFSDYTYSHSKKPCLDLNFYVSVEQLLGYAPDRFQRVRIIAQPWRDLGEGHG